MFGETLARITEAFPHWFAGNYKDFAARADALPVDQHMLLSLIAPRALYVASADEDLWSDPRGEFLSQVHASPVYGLWGDPPMRADEMPPLDRPLIVGPARVSRQNRRAQPDAVRLGSLCRFRGRAVEETAVNCSSRRPYFTAAVTRNTIASAVES